jgi:transcriptional regulator with XRE-family HTH domain
MKPMFGRRARCAYTNLGRRMVERVKTQVALAKILGVSQQTVSKKLRGESAVMIYDLQNLAERLGVSVAWFFRGYKGKPLDIAGE